MFQRALAISGLMAVVLACGGPTGDSVELAAPEPVLKKGLTVEESIDELTRAVLAPPPFIDSDIKDPTPAEEKAAAEAVAAFVKTHPDVVERVDFMVDILEADVVETVAEA